MRSFRRNWTTFRILYGVNSSHHKAFTHTNAHLQRSLSVCWYVSQANDKRQTDCFFLSFFFLSFFFLFYLVFCYSCFFLSFTESGTVLLIDYTLTNLDVSTYQTTYLPVAAFAQLASLRLNGAFHVLQRIQPLFDCTRIPHMKVPMLVFDSVNVVHS